MSVIRLIILLIWLLTPSSIRGQRFHLSYYTTANGLPSNQVRDVCADGFGYVWIATDGGLARFDGRTFKGHFGIMASQYGRDLLSVSDGIWYSNDVGVHHLIPHLDSLEARQVNLPPELTYPNHLFAQEGDTIWVSGPRGKLVKWHEDKSEIMDMGPTSYLENSSSGFSFAETDLNALWVVSSTGWLYRNSATGLVKVDSLGKSKGMIYHDGMLWVAGAQLYKVTLNSNHTGIEKLTALAYQNITAIAKDSRGNIYLGLENRGLHYLDRSSDPYQLKEVYSNNDPHRVDPLPFKNIHKIHVESPQDIWICSAEGLGILQKRFFESVDGLPNNNISSIATGPGGEVFVNSGNLYKITHSDFGYRAESISFSGNVASLGFVKDQLWIGTAGGELLQINDNGRIGKKVDLSSRGEGIFYLFEDSQSRLWFCQAPSEKPIIGVACLLPDGQIKQYDQRHGLGNRILIVREHQGRLYAAGIGTNSYLYRYLPEEDSFVNLSLPMDFPVGQNFEVHDLTIDHKGQGWLATTDGLLQYQIDRVYRVPLGSKLEDVEIRALNTLSDGSIWASTDTHGVLRIKQGEILEMKEESGLPSKIMSYRALIKDRAQRLWIGTAEGLIYSLSPEPQPTHTPTPMLMAVKVNGRKMDHVDLQVAPQDLLEFEINTTAYHGYDLYYQYHLGDSVWNELTSNGRLSIPAGAMGGQVIQLRARQQGGFDWSRPLQVQWEVALPWYKKPIAPIIAGVLVMAVVGFSLWRRRRSVYHSKILALENALENRGRENIAEVSTHHRDSAEKAGFFNQQLLVRTIKHLSPDMKWGAVIEQLAIHILVPESITAFEITSLNGNRLTHEGYSKHTQKFMDTTSAFHDNTSLEAKIVRRQEPLICKTKHDIQDFWSPHDADSPYCSLIAQPMSLKRSSMASICLFSTQANSFQEQDLQTLAVLAAYIQQIS